MKPQNRQTAFVFGIFIFACTALAVRPVTAASPSAGRFFTPVEIFEPRTPISFAGSFSMGFSLDSAVPFSQPFNKSVGAQVSPFRFQVPTAIKLDVSYGFSPSWELGLSAGYMAYESRFQSSVNQIETVNFRSLPIVEVMARYYVNVEQGIAGEFEAGLGYGVGRVTVSSTDSGSIPTQSETLNSISGHLAAGVALGWAENYSAHFLAGFSVFTLNSKVYTDAEVTQSGSLRGLYLKGGLRYQF